MTIIFLVILISCKKEHGSNPAQQPADSSVEPARHILLKDIVEAHLPSPYYHFEYSKDSLITKADFASGFNMYDVIYDGNKIKEMRNNIIVNHDTLRYFYNSSGKVDTIGFINEDNIIYRHVIFTYQGDLVNEILWNHKEVSGDFTTYRILTFVYYPDGNVKSINEYRPPQPGVPEYNSVHTFDQYDKGINVDDFSIIHDGIHDHLFLLQGFRLQKNNPMKESFSVDGVDFYTADYTYVYNADHTPSARNGNVLFESTGQRFVSSSIYSYY